MKINNLKSFERIPVIYGIHNTISDKWYIGSCLDMKDRFQRHRYYLRHNQHHSEKLQRSYNTYGEDAFEVQILYHLNQNDDRFAEEQKYIEEYNSVKNGYNMLEKCIYVNNFNLSEDAKTNYLAYIKTLQKSVIAIDRFTGNIDAVFDSITEAANYYETSTSNISSVCKGKVNYIKDHVFVYSKDFDVTRDYRVNHHCKGKPKPDSQKEKMRHNKRCSPIGKYDADGNLISTYYSIKEASRQINVNEANIRHWIKTGAIHDGYIYKKNN